MKPSTKTNALLALALGSALGACGNDPGQPVDLHGQEVRLTLLHTADWHSRLFPYTQTVSATDANLGLDQSKAPFGGAARMNWLIQRERAHADRVLHLDSGDCFQGAPIFNFFSGEAETRAMALTGVDGVVIGNHEFDRGAVNLYRQFSRWANFPVLAANYQFDDPTRPGSPELGRLARPYHMYNVRGLKVGVIGMGNLSSITSLFDQPNSTGIVALNSRETVQFYVDMLQAQHADVIVVVSHLGLEDDQRVIQNTTGVDVVLGGHLHIVLNPSQEIQDCQPFDAQGHWVPQLDATQDPGPNGNVAQSGGVVAECAPGECCSPTGSCPPEPGAVNPDLQIWRVSRGFHKRRCLPRTVVLQHSGAFMKYLGRLDLVFSDNPDIIGAQRYGQTDWQTAGFDSQQAYDDFRAHNGFEVIGHNFSLFPVDSTVPEEPTMARMLEPYKVALASAANLDNLVGYSPSGVSRTATGGGDSPMGNLVSTAMWRRLGVQTDFALTNTLGIRDSIPAGPVAIDQIFNVFPFDNSITTMYLSGREVLEMFDFVARRSGSRGCASQAQIAGARVVISCGVCDRDGDQVRDTYPGSDTPLPACAETVNIGLQTVPEGVDCAAQAAAGNPAAPCCNTDADCNPPGACGPDEDPCQPQHRSLCEPHAHVCMQRLSLDASYQLAANDYIAAGGSGFFVLQRNTTQTNTGVQLRDAVTDTVQGAKPCGWDPAIDADYRANHPDAPPRSDDGLPACTTDADCGTGYTCGCSERFDVDEAAGTCSDNTLCPDNGGRCVLTQCVTDMVNQIVAQCPRINPPADVDPDHPHARDNCLCASTARAMNTCRVLACFDEKVGAVEDNRLLMVTRTVRQ